MNLFGIQILVKVHQLREVENFRGKEGVHLVRLAEEQLEHLDYLIAVQKPLVFGPLLGQKGQ